jgi:hypothetical protein
MKKTKKLPTNLEVYRKIRKEKAPPSKAFKDKTKYDRKKKKNDEDS